VAAIVGGLLQTSAGEWIFAGASNGIYGARDRWINDLVGFRAERFRDLRGPRCVCPADRTAVATMASSTAIAANSRWMGLLRVEIGIPRQL